MRNFNHHLNSDPEPNLIEITTNNIHIKPITDLRGGSIASGMKIKISGYNLEEILCCLLDDYGEEEILNKIKELEL